MQVFVDFTGDFTVKRVHGFRIFLKPARRDGALASTVCGKLHVHKLGHDMMTTKTNKRRQSAVQLYNCKTFSKRNSQLNNVALGLCHGIS